MKKDNENRETSDKKKIVKTIAHADNCPAQCKCKHKFEHVAKSSSRDACTSAIHKLAETPISKALGISLENA